MFAERLLETAPQSQLAVLCDGGAENGGALALAFVMFLESERMEKQMAEDLKAFGAAGAAHVNDAKEAEMADIAAGYLRSRVATLAQAQAGRDAGAKPNKKKAAGRA
jgi:hypothetical protein